MKQKSKTLSLMGGILTILQAMVDSKPLADVQGVRITKSRNALTLRVPKAQDELILLCTKIDCDTASFVVYWRSQPSLKLYMGHYSRSSTEDAIENANKLMEIVHEVFPILTQKQDTETDESDSYGKQVDMEKVLRVESVQPINITERHLISVSFDDSTTVSISVPQEQLSMFSVGNMLLKNADSLILLQNKANHH